MHGMSSNSLDALRDSHAKET